MVVTMDPTTKRATKRRAEAVVARRADCRARRAEVKRRLHACAVGPVVDGPALFDHQARRALGISGDEFLRRWDGGYYRGIADRDEARKAFRLTLLLPFVRRTPVKG
jgi:hypothetical protein